MIEHHHHEAAAHELCREAAVHRTRCAVPRREDHHRPRAFTAPQQGRGLGVGVDLMVATHEEARHTADVRGQSVAAVDVRQSCVAARRAPTRGGIPDLCDDTAMVGRVVGVWFRSRGVGPAIDLGADRGGTVRRGDRRDGGEDPHAECDGRECGDAESPEPAQGAAGVWRGEGAQHKQGIRWYALPSEAVARPLCGPEQRDECDGRSACRGAGVGRVESPRGDGERTDKEAQVEQQHSRSNEGRYIGGMQAYPAVRCGHSLSWRC